jgi:hypothetical protein
MRKTEFVIPKKGLIVRDPVTKDALPEQGGSVDLNTYWKKRIRDGDVEIAVAKKPTKKIGGDE